MKRNVDQKVPALCGHMNANERRLNSHKSTKNKHQLNPTRSAENTRPWKSPQSVDVYLWWIYEVHNLLPVYKLHIAIHHVVQLTVGDLFLKLKTVPKDPKVSLNRQTIKYEPPQRTPEKENYKPVPGFNKDDTERSS